ncbi:deoxynucleoside kinase [Mycoplasma sp. 5912]
MVIGISGMISSGKSTLSKKLNEHYKTSVILDEFDKDDIVFNTFLKWLYEKKPNLTMALQTYVVENHTTKLQELFTEFAAKHNDLKNNHLVLDRFSIEHYIFAHVNLKVKGRNYLKGYDALFEHMITDEEIPDLAIYLDMSYETFEKRLFERGREVEINNYELNKDYFKNLYRVYKDLFIKQADKYHLNYVIVDTNNLTEAEVLSKAIEIIDNFDLSKAKERVWK